jgi:hypothetical protein
MISRVPDEDARGCARGELVRGRGDHVGVAATPEHPELVVVWRDAKEDRIRRRCGCSAARAPVDQVRGRGERLSLERQGSCTVEGSRWRTRGG